MTRYHNEKPTAGSFGIKMDDMSGTEGLTIRGNSMENRLTLVYRKGDTFVENLAKSNSEF